MQIDRQSLIYGAIGAGVVILAVLAYVLSSSGNSQTGSSGNANIAEAGEIEGDMVMGDPNAPITVIEYASMTCAHCAAFHEQTFPELKKNYIDTGKVRMIFREYPLDDLATAASMLARCAKEDSQKFSMLSLLFKTQREWVAGEKQPVERLSTVVRQAGMGRADVDACLDNKDVFAEIKRFKGTGEEKFEIRSTPTFIINGNKHAGALSFETFESILKPLLPDAS